MPLGMAKVLGIRSANQVRGEGGGGKTLHLRYGKCRVQTKPNHGKLFSVIRWLRFELSSFKIQVSEPYHEPTGSRAIRGESFCETMGKSHHAG